MPAIPIGTRTVGDDHPAFVIAEVGINHGGDRKAAERLVHEAARAGADAVKFQTYVTEKRVARDSPIYDVLKKCELAREAQAELKDVAKEAGVLFFSTPFDAESADFLAGIGVPLFKIASFDIVNLALVRRVAGYRRPMIVSRGMATKAEVDAAVRAVKAAGAPLALLHCISAYPTPRHAANLRVMATMARHYDCPIGFSDHTLGVDVPVLAVAAGAKLIEKHFTLDRSLPGPDHQLSADPAQLAEMVQRIRDTEAVLGRGDLVAYEAEQGTMQYRRPTA